MLRTPRPDDAGRLTRSTQISEILDRQKLLSRNRPPPPAAANLSLADQIRERLRSPAAPGAATAAAQPRPTDYRTPSAEHATVDISEALAKLRQDIKQDLAASFSQELASLRQEIKEIGSAVAENGYPQDLYGDLQRLAEGIEFLGENAETAVANSIRNELESLKSMVEGTVRHDDLAAIAEQLAGLNGNFDPESLHGEIAALADRFETFRTQLSERKTDPLVESLETKIMSLAEAIEMFVSQMSTADRDLNTQMGVLDERLAEIAAAIDGNTRVTSELVGDNGFGAIESQIARLAEEIAAMEMPQREDRLAERIDTLAQRMEDLAKVQATEHLDRRFDELADLVKTGGAATNEDVAAIIADISQKIDDMARGSVSSDLIDRFEDLVTRIDHLDAAGAPAALSEDVLTWLEERMNDIAARIDNNVQAKGSPAADLGALEGQIAQLTKLLSEPRVAGDVNAANMSSRVTALEDYMATNDEYIVEAARQAAETALEAYVRNFSDQASGAGVSQADVSMISDLAADLHALEELTRSGEARSQQTFETLQQTLVQIAERLDRIGQSSEAAAAASDVKAQAPVRAKAPQAARTGTDAQMFVEDFDDEDFFEDSFGTAGNATEPREANQPIKSLLSSIGKRFRNNREDEISEEPRRTLNSAPAIDPADDISPDLANQLLEPGSGAPDIRQILEKVRSVQEPRLGKTESAIKREDDNGDYIAAARRAAQAAAAEVGPVAHGEDDEPATGSIIARYRRPLLLTTGLVVLAVMAWPLVSAFFTEPTAPQPAATAPAAITQKAPETAAPAKPDAKESSALDAPVDVSAAPAVASVAAPTAPDAMPATPAAAETTAKAAPDQAMPAKDATAPAAKVEDGAAVTAPAPAAPADAKAANAEPAAPQAAADKAPVSEPAAAPAAAASTDASAAKDAVSAPAADTAASPALAVPAGIEPVALVDAAKGNDPLAVYEVGNRIFDGRGVPADPAAAVTWYEKSASLGFAPAEYRLGNMFEKGIGVKADVQKAIGYYESAATAGNISAMHNLAVLYATGTTGAPDFTSAAKWFTEAANHGVRDSQFNLAILYAKGSGVEQNLEQSYKWFGIAAKDGDTDAAQKRDEVGKVLTGDQMTKAKAEIDGWKVAPIDDKANATIIPDAWAGKPQKTSSVDMKKAITYIQAMLNKNGFDVGRPDGVMGAKTVAAIKSFQSSVGQQPTGDINDALVKELIARSK